MTIFPVPRGRRLTGFVLEFEGAEDGLEELLSALNETYNRIRKRDLVRVPMYHGGAYEYFDLASVSGTMTLRHEEVPT